MALFRRAVAGPLQRPQHGEMHRPLLRPALHLVQQFLQFEAAPQIGNRQPQFADELPQRLDLGRTGRLVDAAQEGQLLVAQRLGHGLVGRQHELLDHLVALRVGHRPGADHLAGSVQVHLDLGHVEFQRALFQPPLPQHHRQRVHGAQQGVDLRPQFAAPRRPVGQERVDLLVAEPLAAADGGRVELRVDAHPLGSELHERRARCSAPCPAEGSPGCWK